MSLQAGLKVFSDAANPQDRLRRLVRVVVLVAAALSLWPILPGDSTLAFVSALSPFVTVGTILATHGLHALAWLGLVVGLVVLIRRRLFCRWVCPVGLCMDAMSRLGSRLGRRSAGFPKLGPWIVLLTLGGACLGFPLFLWLDPLSRLAGVFDLAGQGPRLGAVVSIAAFLLMLLLTLLWPNAWCGRACPLGSFQDLLFALPRLCRSLLPGVRKTAPQASVEWPLSRRFLLGGAAGAACAGAMRLLGRGKPSSLRPPGAILEPAFSGVCTRCGNCIRVCPSGVIEPDVGEGGWASLFTPTLRFRKDYCREDCVRCTEVCPSGALARVPLAKKAHVQVGLPRVDMNVCLLGEDRECSLCRSRCPYGAIRYVFSEADYTLTPQIDPKRCNGCGACEAACPTSPRKAIVVVAT